MLSDKNHHVGSLKSHTKKMSSISKSRAPLPKKGTMSSILASNHARELTVQSS